jgi:hypothetical protein
VSDSAPIRFDGYLYCFSGVEKLEFSVMKRGGHFTLSEILPIFICRDLAAQPQPSPASIRYISAGDSYPLGEGSNPKESWPAVLASPLTADGIPVELKANLAWNGLVNDSGDFARFTGSQIHITGFFENFAGAAVFSRARYRSRA